MPKTVSFLVDGFNMYHSLNELQGVSKASVKWLDLMALCKAYLPSVRSNIGEPVDLAKVHYFSARPDFLSAHKPDTLLRYDTYITALRRCPTPRRRTGPPRAPSSSAGPARRCAPREHEQDGSPLFHPFRIYPLHRIVQACDLHIAPSTSLHRERLRSFLNEVVERRLRPLEQIGEIAESANAAVDLAIIIEPICWPTVTARWVYRGPIDEHEHHERLKTYWHSVRELVAGLDPDHWRAVHEELRMQAAILDENDTLYLLLRLAPWAQRERLRGRISGALWIRHIAEVLRRAFEEVHQVEWPEEDQSFGQWLSGARVAIYGSERPLDRPMASIPYLAFEFGLYTGSIVRWYVEGETEYGAISEVLSQVLGSAAIGGIELVNLKGSPEKKRLSDALEQDLALRRFSVISIDTDQADALRTIRQQVRQNKVVGFVAASTPDFEFASFSLAELVEIAAQREEQAGFSGDVIRNGDWTGVTSSKKFQGRYEQLSLGGSRVKGTGWGAALGRYAAANPTRADGGRRPLLKSIEMALRCRVVPYDLHRARYRIDPETFELVEGADSA